MHLIIRFVPLIFHINLSKFTFPEPGSLLKTQNFVGSQTNILNLWFIEINIVLRFRLVKDRPLTVVTMTISGNYIYDLQFHFMDGRMLITSLARDGMRHFYVSDEMTDLRAPSAEKKVML
jgi:hypothetical protein